MLVSLLPMHEPEDARKVIHILFFAFLLLFPNARLLSQVIITDNDTYSPEELVYNILLGSCVEVSNVEYTGDSNSIGYFSNGGSLGLQDGILLTSGSTDVAVGPNDATDATFVAYRAGDAALESVTGVSATMDACILEFDFTSYNNVITFRYIFASEEYSEFVCSQFNDVFAFMVSGPGFAPNTNVALIPATVTPVAINTINGGVAGPSFNNCPAGGLTNTLYYVDNTGSTNVQYDGYTVPLTATINITPCEIYHIRLAVADVWDQYLDSGVFLEAQSFTGGQCDSCGKNKISGAILTEQGVPIPGVAVALTGTNSRSAVTGIDGRYIFTVEQGGNYTVTPSKTNDVTSNNGISSIDILLMKRYILNILPLGSPYKIIAADVDSSNSVTSVDILYCRSMILQMTSTFPNGRLWSFVPDDYVFADQLNPFPFPSTRTYTNLQQSSINQDFIGIKLGDVNDSWDPNIP